MFQTTAMKKKSDFVVVWFLIIQYLTEHKVIPKNPNYRKMLGFFILYFIFCIKFNERLTL